MKLIIAALALVFFSGCQTVPKSSSESSKEAVEALTTVSESVIGKNLSEEDLKNLNQQMRSDKEARGAVETLTNSMAGAAVIKYCPVDGERFAAYLIKCPTHQVDLKEVEP